MAKNLMVWLVIAVVLMTMFNSFSPADRSDRSTSYTQFINDVNQGQIREVQVDRGGVVRAVRKDGQRIETTIPGGYDEKLLDDLIKNNVDSTGVKPEETSLLGQIFISWFPMLLLIGVWIFFMRQMQGNPYTN